MKSEHAATDAHGDSADTSPSQQQGHQDSHPAVPLHCLADADPMRLQSGVAEGGSAVNHPHVRHGDGLDRSTRGKVREIDSTRQSACSVQPSNATAAVTCKPSRDGKPCLYIVSKVITSPQHDPGSRQH